MNGRLRTYFNDLDGNSLSKRFRAKRMEFFRDWLGSDVVTILDVGGTEQFWEACGASILQGREIDLLNLEETKVSLENVRSIAGDATNLSEFDNDSFDLVFSNSVIEHVGSRQNQKRMANEVMRVGKRWFIQTPNKHFPIEPHFVFPFIQYFPKTWRYQIAVRWPLARRAYRNPELARQVTEEIELLTEAEFCSMFGRAQIYHERLFGLTKSFIAYSA